ncbi:MAG: hypothetical protein KFF50_17595 [Desulfatitalea sp.]|nr:hypothetical protein [Desulfatitalea sp.]
MFLRLLIWAIAALLIYRALKSWFGGGGSRQVRTDHHPPKQVDDDLVQDPQCGIYFARRNGVSLNVDGQEILFCSEKCRDAFAAQKE